MPASPTTKLPDHALTTVTLVQTLGFNWEFDHDYLTPRGEKEQRIQIRDEDHVAPTSQVTFYAAEMRRGVKFPPIVVTRDGYIVDGNTRIAAANRKPPLPTLPAVILNENWTGASDGVQRRLHVLGAAFNIKNGKGIDQKEIKRAIYKLAEDSGYDGVRIAALLGCPDRVVKDALAEKRAKDRGEAAGIHVNGSIPATQLRRLGGASNTLHTAPFVELLTLQQDAGLTDAELRGLIVKVQGAKDDDAALALLRGERDSRHEQIADFTARGKALPSASVKLRQRLGFILPFEDTPDSLVEHSPNFSGVHLRQIETVISILQRTAAAQRTR